MANLRPTTITGTLTTTGYINNSANTGVKYIRYFDTNQTGAYTWGNVFLSYWQTSGYFSTRMIYQFWLVSSNYVHYNGYTGTLSTGYLVGANGYGGPTLDWGVSSITFAGGPWTGGCGQNPISSIDTSGFTYSINACPEALNLLVKPLT